MSSEPEFHENLFCPACGSKDFFTMKKFGQKEKTSYLEYSKLFYDKKIDFFLELFPPILCKCTSCTHIFYRYVPSESLLSIMYSSLIRSPNSPNPSRPPNDLMTNEMRRLRKIIRKENPTFLDFGAGYCRWSKAAQVAGFDVIAYEPHSCRSNHDEDLAIYSSLNALANHKFDVIWLEQVLEHVIYPSKTMNQITRFMHPKTILRLNVPNVNRVKGGGSHWNDWPFNGKSSHIMAPYQHLHGFSQRSISVLHQNHNLVNVNHRIICLHDLLHVIRLYFGRRVQCLSTTKRYLIQKSK